MGIWVEVEDIERRFRTLTPAEKLAAEEFIDDAEDELQAKVADLAARVTRGEVPERRVYRIICDAVIAVLRNPDGWVTRSETRGPFSVSVTRAAGAVSTRVTFSDEDLAALRPDVSPVGSVPVGLRPWQIP